MTVARMYFFMIFLLCDLNFFNIAGEMNAAPQAVLARYRLHEAYALYMVGVLRHGLSLFSPSAD